MQKFTLTEFGKFCRKLRIDHNETMSVMASKLGYSTAFLSAVELGKRGVTKKFITRFLEVYPLSEPELSELQTAITKSRDSITLCMDSLTPDEKMVVTAFAQFLENTSAVRERKLLLKQLNRLLTHCEHSPFL